MVQRLMKLSPIHRFSGNPKPLYLYHFLERGSSQYQSGGVRSFRPATLFGRKRLRVILSNHVAGWNLRWKARQVSRI
jgi:hypothetical protein